MRCIKKVHLIGIGGAGMGGIAEVLHHLDYDVSGSDLNNNKMTEHLSNIGIKIFIGHAANNIQQADVVVVSSAIGVENSEVLAAKELRIPIVKRAEMLGELMRFRQGIAVAGTHGKTTTTSLIASIMAEAKLEPTFVIGGCLKSYGGNACLGRGKYFIAEADESDASFLHLTPLIAIITNIDRDHLEAYDNDFNKLKQAFLDFLHNMPFYGLAVICVDDPELNNMRTDIARPTVTYGLDNDADYHGEIIKQEAGYSIFNIKYKNNKTFTVQLNLPGKHNVLNALAAIAVAIEEGVAEDAIKSALIKFQGIERRMQNLGNYKNKNLFIDDYGHHPREIAAVLESVHTGWPDKRIVMLFQPHRYSRTKALFDDFVEVLSKVGVLILLEVYPAGESHIPAADSRALAHSIRQRGRISPIVVTEMDTLSNILDEILQPEDILLTQGAGDIGKIARRLAGC